MLSTGERLLLMRNPHASDSYTGKWSDRSRAWTKQLRKEVSLVRESDGMFYIQIEDYMNNF